MATGYLVSGRGDLDALFKARASAAGANTGYKSNGGVDLAQRFEPRGTTTAIAATNFKAGANDLAQVFMDIAGVINPTVMAMVAGESGNTDLGYADGHANEAIPGASMVPNIVGANELCELVTATNFFRAISFTHPTVSPVNTNATWSTCTCTGVFNGTGASPVSRVLTRSAGTYSTGAAAGRRYAYWTYGSSDWQFIPNNTYTVSVLTA